MSDLEKEVMLAATRMKVVDRETVIVEFGDDAPEPEQQALKDFVYEYAPHSPGGALIPTKTICILPIITLRKGKPKMLNFGIGIAYCSVKDFPNKTVGRRIAYSRAFAAQRERKHFDNKAKEAYIAVYVAPDQVKMILYEIEFSSRTHNSINESVKYLTEKILGKKWKDCHDV